MNSFAKILFDKFTLLRANKYVKLIFLAVLAWKEKTVSRMASQKIFICCSSKDVLILNELDIKILLDICTLPTGR